MEREIKLLLNWLEGSGKFSLTSRVNVNESESSGRGVVLIEGSLRTNDVIVSVPATHQLNFNSVLYHISIFNSELKVPGVTITSEDRESTKTDPNDTRFLAYGVLDQDFLLNLSSFQLVTLYILAEWVLLPLWSNNASNSFWKPFFDVWPSSEELRSIPAIWNCSRRSKYKSLLHLLPLASKNDYVRISSLVELDWSVISPILKKWGDMFGKARQDYPSVEQLYESFLHVYFVINSRCLHAEIALKTDDMPSQFTMVPYVDFINHTDETDLHCYPKLNQSPQNVHDIGQFEILCGEYCYENKGEQLLLNYGPHSNDFLLSEYGFTLEHNKWDYVDISDEVMKMMEGKDELESFLKYHEYWGDYTISLNEVSYRIIVALSLIVTLDFKRVEKLLNGYMSEDYFLPTITPVLQKILKRLLNTYRKKIENLQDASMESVDDFCVRNVTKLYSSYIEIIENNLESS